MNLSLQTLQSVASTCSAWRSLALEMFLEKPWSDVNQSQGVAATIARPVHLLTQVPPSYPVTRVRCFIIRRPGSLGGLASRTTFELWQGDSPSAAKRPRFLLSAQQTGWASFTIGLRRPPTAPPLLPTQAPTGDLLQAEVSLPLPPPPSRRASPCGKAAATTPRLREELEVARLVGDRARTQYRLLASNKPWVTRALLGASGGTGAGSGSLPGAATTGMPPLLTAHYSVRLNGMLMPRR